MDPCIPFPRKPSFPASHRSGRFLTGIAVAFLLWDSVIKLLVIEAVREGLARLGYVRIGDPIFTHMLFPIYVATLLWAGCTCAMPGFGRSFQAPRESLPRERFTASTGLRVGSRGS